MPTVAPSCQPSSARAIGDTTTAKRTRCVDEEFVVVSTLQSDSISFQPEAAFSLMRQRGTPVRRQSNSTPFHRGVDPDRYRRIEADSSTCVTLRKPSSACTYASR